MSGKIILVTGGARSGKSSFAERLAHKLQGKTAYIATAQIFDHEMQERVSLHRERRPENWRTYECPYDADKLLASIGGLYDVILFDCLTLYVTNILLSPDKPADVKQHIIILAEQLFKAADAAKGTVIFVTNEVGMGIVPDNELAREFRDIAGIVNALAAAYAGKVYWVVSGLPVEIKALAANVMKEL